MEVQNNWYKNNPTDRFWWLDNEGIDGEFVFTFDKKKTFNLFQDYPHKLTKEEKEMFDEDTEYYWAAFFKDRE